MLQGVGNKQEDVLGQLETPEQGQILSWPWAWWDSRALSQNLKEITDEYEAALDSITIQLTHVNSKISMICL